jgi:uncharacterized protein YdiU (UPF0061 family)
VSDEGGKLWQLVDLLTKQNEIYVNTISSMQRELTQYRNQFKSLANTFKIDSSKIEQPSISAEELEGLLKKIASSVHSLLQDSKKQIKEVQVPIFVEKEVIVERRIEVPVEVERLVEIERIIEVERHIEVERPVFVEKIVERIVEIEKIVEVPVEVPIYVERIVEVMKPVYIEREI